MNLTQKIIATAVAGAVAVGCYRQNNIANLGFVNQAGLKPWVDANSRYRGHPSGLFRKHASKELTIPASDSVVHIVYSGTSSDYYSKNPYVHVEKIVLCRGPCEDGEILHEGGSGISTTSNFPLSPPISGIYTLDVHLTNGAKETATANLIVE